MSLHERTSLSYNLGPNTASNLPKNTDFQLTDVQVDGRTGGRAYKRTDIQAYGLTSGRTYRRTEVQADGRTSGRADGWIYRARELESRILTT